MGKRGKKPKQIRIEIGKIEGDLRYDSPMDALIAALPDIAEAIAKGESTSTTKRDKAYNPKIHPE